MLSGPGYCRKYLMPGEKLQEKDKVYDFFDWLALKSRPKNKVAQAAPPNSASDVSKRTSQKVKHF